MRAWILWLLLAWGLSGCGEQSALPGAADVAPGLPSPLAIPFPDDRSASSLTAYSLLGKAAQLRSPHAVNDGTALQLAPVAGTADYGVYRFKLLAAPDHVQVSLGSGTTAAWIGIADYSAQRWVFHGPYTSSQDFALSSTHNVSPLGNVFVAVLAGAGGHALVDQVQVYAANLPPTADFTPSPPAGVKPLSVDFDASASTDADGTITRYEWDFDNDGDYEVDQGGQPLAQFVFAEVGTYHVSLRVTDSSGDTDTHSADIVVEHAPPVASFTVTADQQINPLVLNYSFDATASYDPEGGALSYDWDFDGDGQWDIIGGSAIENRSYPNIGVYPAQLRVTNPASLNATATQTVYCPSVWSSFAGPPGCTTRQSPVVGAQTNNVKWTFAAGSFINSTPAIGPDGTVYIGSYDHKVYALLDNGTATPTVKWSYTTGGGILETSPAVGADGTVYIGSDDGNTYALADNGTAMPTVKWSYPTGGVSGGPCIGLDGTVYVCGNVPFPQGKVFALADNGTATPTLKWSFTAGAGVISSPCIGPDCTVYISSEDKNVYALVDNGTATPTVKWSYTAGYVGSSPALGPDGTVYFQDDNYPNSKAYALVDNGTATPTVKWSYPVGGSSEGSPAVGPDGTVYIGSGDGSFYALVDNGTPTPTVKWSFTAGFTFSGESPVIGQDGTIYVACDDGTLYALIGNGTDTPTVKWNYATGSGIFQSVAIGTDGTVYGADYSGTVYAFGP